MQIAVLHPNFPGQFRRLCHLWVQNGLHEVVALGGRDAPGLPGITTHRVIPHRTGSPGVHPYLRSLEAAVIRGQSVARRLRQLRGRVSPDVVIAHPGWGDALFVKEVFPETKLLNFCEFFYLSEGGDMNFDPEFCSTPDDIARARVRNALHLLNLEYCDLAVSPTEWQRSVHPTAYQGKIRVVHEGVDVGYLSRQAVPVPGNLMLADGYVLTPKHKIVTYIARNLEPYRGFHTMMRACNEILSRDPEVHVVLVGGTDVSYGSRPAGGGSWRDVMIRETGINNPRLHFTGKMSYADLRHLMLLSSVHVYLTYPFVLSWSMLEAMACECLVVGSDTAPVREVIRHGENGLLVDFFSPTGLSSTVLDCLARPDIFRPLRTAARQTVVERYSQDAGYAGYASLLQSLF